MFTTWERHCRKREHQGKGLQGENLYEDFQVQPNAQCDQLLSGRVGSWHGTDRQRARTMQRPPNKAESYLR